VKLLRKMMLGNPPLKRIDRACHIRRNVMGAAPMLCGLRSRRSVHGGMAVATCKVCMRCAFLEGHLDDLLPEVARRCLRRMRRMGVSTSRPQAAQGVRRKKAA
jgi:hypothetical protein